MDALNNIDLALIVYLGGMLGLYFYTQKQDSQGFFWIVLYFCGGWLLEEKLGAPLLHASGVMFGSLIVTFEISRRFWEDPFSEANVIQFLLKIFNVFKKLLSILGLKPKSKIINFEEAKEIKEIIDLLKAHKWEEAETAISCYEDNELNHVISVLGDRSGRPKEYDEWITARPESYLAFTISGLSMTDYAWEARGGGVSSTVTNQGYQDFFDRLATAFQHLEQAIELNPDCAEPYAGLIPVSMGLQIEKSQLWEYYVKALKLVPNHYGIRGLMLNAVAEKWGGSEQNMFRVAEGSYKEARDGDPLLAVIVQAHIEKWLYLGMDDQDAEQNLYFTHADVVDDIKTAFERFKNGSLDSPQHIHALNLFACGLYQAGLYSFAKEAVDLLDGRYLEYPWNYFGESFFSILDEGFVIDEILQDLNSKGSDRVPSQTQWKRKKDSVEAEEAHKDHYEEEEEYDDTICAVVLHNDPITTLGFVLSAIKNIFGYSTWGALKVIYHVQFKGSWPVWIGEATIAKKLVKQVQDLGPDPEVVDKGAVPLNVTIEEVEEID